MRHLVDDAPHAQTARHLPHRLPIQERDAPDIREMREDKRPNGFQYVLHGVPPLICIAVLHPKGRWRNVPKRTLVAQVEEVRVLPPADCVVQAKRVSQCAGI